MPSFYMVLNVLESLWVRPWYSEISRRKRCAYTIDLPTHSAKSWANNTTQVTLPTLVIPLEAIGDQDPSAREAVG